MVIRRLGWPTTVRGFRRYACPTACRPFSVAGDPARRTDYYMGVTQPPTPDVLAAEASGQSAEARTRNSLQLAKTTRRVKQVVTAVVLVSLLVLSTIFYVTGVHKNSQIDSLRHQGRAMSVSVVGCQGLLGGSGSNAVGYTCKVRYTVAHHSYDETLPGNVFLRPGAQLKAIVVPSDPRLISTPAIVASDHTSNRVFLLPTVLLAILLVLGATVIVLSRRRPNPA